MILLEQLDLIRASEKLAAESRDHDVLVEVERVRDALDAVERSVRKGEALASSASGETFFADSARRLTHSLYQRDEAYRVLALLDGLRSRAEKEV